MADESKYYKDTCWWDPKRRSGEPHRIMIPSWRSELSDQAALYDNIRQYISCYDYGSLYLNRADSGRVDFVNRDILSHNQSKIVIDTIIADLFSAEIIPMALTKAGSVSDMIKAREFTRAMEGLFDEIDYERLEADVGRNFEICGLGGLYFYEDSGKLAVDSIRPQDLLYPLAECRYGKPQTLYYRYYVNRYRLAAIYGVNNKDFYGRASERKEKILECPKATSEYEDIVGPDTLEVVIGWHLPSVEPKEDEDECDGRVTVCIETCTLEDKEFRSPRFPIAIYNPIPAKRNPSWGIPSMQLILPSQVMLDQLKWCEQRAFEQVGMSAIIVDKESDISIDQIGNGFGYVIKKSLPGNVQVFSPQPINPSFFSFEDKIRQDMFAAGGTSEFTSQGSLPPGLSDPSGKALMLFEDVINRRNSRKHRAREQLMKESVIRAVDVIRDIVASHPDYEVSNCRSKAGFKTMKWKEVLLPEDSCKWIVFPVSGLSQLPSAKFAELLNLLSAGAIDLMQFRKLYGLPDLENDLDADSASLEVIDVTIDKILIEKKYIPPQNFDDLKLVVRRATDKYNLYRSRDVPEANLNYLRQYIEEAQELIKQDMERAQAEAAPPPGMGIDPAMPPPPEEGLPPDMAMMPPGPEAMVPEDIPPEGMLPPELP